MYPPIKPENYPIIVLPTCIFAERRWGRLKLSSPLLKTITWEITDLAGLYIVEDFELNESFLDKHGISFTSFVSKQEIKEYDGLEHFLEWVHYGKHPVYALLPNTEENSHIQGVQLFDGGFEEVKQQLFDIVTQLRKI